uniref:Uncharacterized protein n=1 Tax=Parastrongyloides trichosuri TaxID=131310 RepID=A0A0N4ZDK9_PARTI
MVSLKKLLLLSIFISIASFLKASSEEENDGSIVLLNSDPNVPIYANRMKSASKKKTTKRKKPVTKKKTTSKGVTKSAGGTTTVGTDSTTESAVETTLGI